MSSAACPIPSVPGRDSAEYSPEHRGSGSQPGNRQYQSFFRFTTPMMMSGAVSGAILIFATILALAFRISGKKEIAM